MGGGDKNFEAAMASCLKAADTLPLSLEQTREKESEKGLRENGFEDHSQVMLSACGTPSTVQNKTLSLPS